MYKFITNDNVSYEIINTTTFEPVKLDITPTKLFNNDIFNVPNIIVQSSIRQNKYIAGILILNKTYGKEGKKFLYLCQPDDKRLPLFLIPYVIPVSFNKSLNNLYITFEFTNWDHKYPYGIITQNLGPVNDISNFYEYMMYSKKLNVSIHQFTKHTTDIINKNTNIINDIINKYNISIIDDSVITIDAPNSIDLDDGISIKDNIISVYIANVPIIIEYLQLWESFTNRISNIYLPNKKYNMLPAILGQICSLNKETVRICLKIDFNIDTNETNISNCAVKIHNNYTYLDESLNNNDTYNKIKNIYKNKNSSQIIELLMIKTNTICAEYMKKYKNGIYKIITHSEKLTNSSYELYNDTCNYLTVTSPIRRLIDILNIYKLSDNEKIFKFNDNAEQFYLNWINELKYINLTSKNIRKVQSKCTILNICVNNNHCIYKGKVFDKIIIKNMFKYQVYIQELKIYSKIYCDKELDENLEYNFKIFVFQTESNLKNKIKLDIIFTD
jgi:exoribonuclease R